MIIIECSDACNDDGGSCDCEKSPGVCKELTCILHNQQVGQEEEEKLKEHQSSAGRIQNGCRTDENFLSRRSISTESCILLHHHHHHQHQHDQNNDCHSNKGSDVDEWATMSDVGKSEAIEDIRKRVCFLEENLLRISKSVYYMSPKKLNQTNGQLELNGETVDINRSNGQEDDDDEDDEESDRKISNKKVQKMPRIYKRLRFRKARTWNYKAILNERRLKKRITKLENVFDRLHHLSHQCTNCTRKDEEDEDVNEIDERQSNSTIDNDKDSIVHNKDIVDVAINNSFLKKKNSKSKDTNNDISELDLSITSDLYHNISKSNNSNANHHHTLHYSSSVEQTYPYLHDSSSALLNNNDNLNDENEAVNLYVNKRSKFQKLASKEHCSSNTNDSEYPSLKAIENNQNDICTIEPLLNQNILMSNKNSENRDFTDNTKCNKIGNLITNCPEQTTNLWNQLGSMLSAEARDALQTRIQAIQSNAKCTPPSPTLTSDTAASSVKNRCGNSQDDEQCELDTLQVSETVRKLLNSLNIGQRVFAKCVLGLSQGTVSELLSKPRCWAKLTEKGKDSYRKMWMWANNPEEILALKEISSRREATRNEQRTSSVVRIKNEKETPELTQRIHGILGDAAKQIKKETIDDKSNFYLYNQLSRLNDNRNSIRSDSFPGLFNEDTSTTTTTDRNVSLDLKTTALKQSPNRSSYNKSTVLASFKCTSHPDKSLKPIQKSTSQSSGRQHHQPVLYGDLSQIDVKQLGTLDTVLLVQEVKQVLNGNSISQRQFGELVLGLSQGSVSDLLARPKCWSALTQKGREPFIRMKLFLDDPSKYEGLFDQSGRAGRQSAVRKNNGNMNGSSVVNGANNTNVLLIKEDTSIGNVSSLINTISNCNNSAQKRTRFGSSMVNNVSEVSNKSSDSYSNMQNAFMTTTTMADSDKDTNNLNNIEHCLSKKDVQSNSSFTKYNTADHQINTMRSIFNTHVDSLVGNCSSVLNNLNHINNPSSSPLSFNANNLFNWLNNNKPELLTSAAATAFANQNQFSDNNAYSSNNRTNQTQINDNLTIQYMKNSIINNDEGIDLKSIEPTSPDTPLSFMSSSQHDNDENMMIVRSDIVSGVEEARSVDDTPLNSNGLFNNRQDELTNEHFNEKEHLSLDGDSNDCIKRRIFDSYCVPSSPSLNSPNTNSIDNESNGNNIEDVDSQMTFQTSAKRKKFRPRKWASYEVEDENDRPSGKISNDFENRLCNENCSINSSTNLINTEQLTVTNFDKDDRDCNGESVVMNKSYDVLSSSTTTTTNKCVYDCYRSVDEPINRNLISPQTSETTMTAADSGGDFEKNAQ